METRAHHVIIGLFTVIGVAAVLLFALWMARPAADRDYDYYIIAFTRPVSGLSVGNRVEYSGVRVGEVIDLQLNPKDPRRVRALIRVEEDTPVNVDTQADLALANISGARKIQLYGGTPESSPLPGELDDPPVIVAEPSAISAVLETSEDLIVRVDEFVQKANALLSEQNIDRVSQTLREFSRLSTQANSALAEITQLVDNTDASLNDPERGVLPKAAQSAAALERASEQVDDLLTNNQRALNSGLQGFENLGPALVDLRSALDNINRITERLEDNPRRFLLRGEDIQEFEP